MKLRLPLAVFVLAVVLTSSWAQDDVVDYIVVLRPGQAISQLNLQNGAQIIGSIAGAPILLISANNPAIEQIKLDKAVESVEKNVGVKLRSIREVSLSPSAAEQQTVSLDDHTLTTFYGTNVLKSYVNQPALTLTRVDAVRGISTGAGTRMAYIDTGVDPYHPALQPWLDPGIDLVFGKSTSELEGLSQQMASLLDQQMASLLDKRFMFLLNQAMASLLDNGPDTFPSALGHGTLVAGILHVVAPEARIIPIKAFDAYGCTTMFTITDAVYRAKSLGVDVLNMSFSTTENSYAFRKAVVDATAYGISVVASVGNEAREITSTNLYPASYGSVYGVAATDFNDRLASFSNYGLTVDVTAPGSYVISTAPNGRYAAAWGTSFSAPLVSGAIALQASSRGYGQSDGMRVMYTADNIDKLNPGFEGKLGRGRINVLKALRGPQ